MIKSNFCIYCKTTLEKDKNMLSFKSEYSSLYKKNSFNDPENFHNYYLTKCGNCNLIYINSDSEKEFLGFLNYKIKNKEPTYHIGFISEIIKNLIGNNTIYNIVYSSYKDRNLLNKIVEKDKSKFNVYEFQTFKKSIYKESSFKNIFLLTRFIEHINKKNFLDNYIKSIKEKDLLCLEILNFSESIKNNDISFIWDERINYPSSDFLIKFFKSHGFKKIDSYEFDKGDKFNFIIFERVQKEIVNFALSSSNKNILLDINKYKKVLLKKTSQIIQNYSSLAIFGAGHKSLTFLSFIMNLDDKFDIEIFDSSEEKIGSFWNKREIKDISNFYYKKNQLNIFSFSGNNADLICSKILKQDKNASIMQLKNFFKFNNDKNI